jgi:hypothetical protein
MANNERLTKRVKVMEDWIAENEGGPTLNNFNYLLDMLRNASQQAMNMERNFNTQRELLSEFCTTNDLMEKYNNFIQEKNDAVQKQQTEEVSVQEEAESSEEAIEEEEEKE